MLTCEHCKRQFEKPDVKTILKNGWWAVVYCSRTCMHEDVYKGQKVASK